MIKGKQYTDKRHRPIMYEWCYRLILTAIFDLYENRVTGYFQGLLGNPPLSSTPFPLLDQEYSDFDEDEEEEAEAIPARPPKPTAKKPIAKAQAAEIREFKKQIKVMEQSHAKSEARMLDELNTRRKEATDAECRAQEAEAETMSVTRDLRAMQTAGGYEADLVRLLQDNPSTLSQAELQRIVSFSRNSLQLAEVQLESRSQVVKPGDDSNDMVDTDKGTVGIDGTAPPATEPTCNKPGSSTQHAIVLDE